MTIVVVNQGEEAFLDLITDIDMTLRLYRNNVTSGLTPDQIDALTQASFTEANFAGYAGSSMTTSWTTTQGNPSTATRAEISFSRSSTGTAQLIYGYYVTRNSDGALQWFEHFPAPVSVEFINDVIKVTPTITLDDTEANVVPTGMITPYGAAAAPLGWLLCDGSAVSRSTYAALFAVVGTTYGTGDGSTTFNVPDLRQRFPLGKAASGTGATLGGTGGTIDHVHALDSATSHAKIAMNDTIDQISSEVKAVTNWTRNAGASLVTNNTGATDSIGAKLAGNSDTANPPFQVVTYIVKT